MKGHIFSSTWIECCTSRSQITNHKVTFSGGRNVTEPCKLWKTELLLKSGLCSSATSVQQLSNHVGSVQTLLGQLHLHKSASPSAFYLTVLSQRATTTAKVIFWGVVIISLDLSSISVWLASHCHHLGMGFLIAFPKGDEFLKVDSYLASSGWMGFHIHLNLQ